MTATQDGDPITEARLAELLHHATDGAVDVTYNGHGQGRIYVEGVGTNTAVAVDLGAVVQGLRAGIPPTKGRAVDPHLLRPGDRLVIRDRQPAGSLSLHMVTVKTLIAAGLTDLDDGYWAFSGAWAKTGRVRTWVLVDEDPEDPEAEEPPLKTPKTPTPEDPATEDKDTR